MVSDMKVYEMTGLRFWLTNPIKKPLVVQVVNKSLFWKPKF